MSGEKLPDAKVPDVCGDAPPDGGVDHANFWDEDTFFNSVGALQLPAASTFLPSDPLGDSFSLFHHVESGIAVDAIGAGAAPSLEAVGSMSPSSARQKNKSKVNGLPQRKEKGKKGKGEKSLSERALMVKRKKAVIAAKANREKRKREMNDLRRMNAELIQERKEFRQIIADLQLQAQANRKAGEIDLETENELLRAELQEHKTFLAQFKSITDGTPVSQAEKHMAALKGAKAAIGQVLGVLHTSTVDPSWKRGYSRLHPETGLLYQRLPLGSTCKTASRITTRIEFPLVKASLNDLHDIQWRVWSDSDLSARLSRHFGEVREKEIKEIDLNLDDLKCGPDAKVKVYYYREDRARAATAPPPFEKAEKTTEPTDSVDTIFLITSKKEELPYHPIPLGNGVKMEGQPGQNGTEPKVYPTIVMATTSTKHSTDIVSSKPGVRRIESALLEGIVLRQIREGEISCTWVASYPVATDSSSPSGFLSSFNAEGWIDDDGYYTKVADKAANDLMRIFVENLGPETAKDYLVKAMEATSLGEDTMKTEHA